MDSTDLPGAVIVNTHVTVRGKKYLRYLVRYTEGGRRVRKVFSALADARRFAEQADRDAALEAERQGILSRRIGEDDAAKLNAEHLRDALAAMAILAGRGTLAAAAQTFVEVYEARRRDVPTVGELVTTYLSESAAHGLRERSIGDLRHRLDRLTEAFGNRKVNAVTHADAQQWLAGLRARDGKPLSGLSRQHFRFAAGALFSRAVELGYIEANPVANRTSSRRQAGSNRMESTAGILTPAEARALLNAAVEVAPETVASLALALFAGVRTAELSRLDWERHVSMAKGMIHITGDVAKKRSVRNIEILPNLARWLALAPSRTGFVAPQGGSWRAGMELVREKAGLARWPHNCLRHSFASYHLEAFRDPQATSLMLGHRGGDDLLFEHYRQLTTAEAAAEFFAIAPPTRKGAIMLGSVASAHA
jgi:integrase